jgi:hypothetical protein
MVNAAARVLRSRAFQGWCILLLCVELLGFALSSGAAHGYDFRAFYAAGHIARTSISSLYDVSTQKAVEDAFVSPSSAFMPFYHPSYEALLFVPFSLLPYNIAYCLNIAVSAVLLFLAYLTGPRHSVFPLARQSRAFAWFTFLPIFLTMLVGQDCILFLLICCLSFRKLEQHDEWTAGFILGLGIFRPQLAIPIGLLLAFRYGRRFFTSFAVVSLVLAAFSAFLVRKEGVAALTSLISAVSLVNNQRPEVQQALSVYPQRMPNLYGLLYISGGRHLSAAASFMVVLAVSLIVFAFCAYVIRRSRSAATSFAIAILGATLLSFHFFSYDATILLLPILLLSGRLHTYLVVVCYALPYLLFFWGIPDWFALLTPVPLALLIVASAKLLRSHPHPALAWKQLLSESPATPHPSSTASTARPS